MKLITIALFCVVGSISLAEMKEGPTPNDDEHPCLEEVKKICPGIQMGPDIGKCIQQNKSKFSSACQTRMKEGAEKMKAMITACKDDANKFCADQKPGGGRIFDCLKTNEAKLSAACKVQIAKAHSHSPGN